MSTNKGMITNSFSKLNEVATKIDQPKSALGVVAKYAIQGAIGYAAVELVRKGVRKASEMKNRRKAA